MQATLSPDRHERLFSDIQAGRYNVGDPTYAMDAILESNRADLLPNIRQAIQKMHTAGTRSYVMSALEIVHTKGDHEMLKTMSEIGMDIHGNKGFPIFHEYLDKHQDQANPEAVKAMEGAGFDLNAQDYLGNTPLHLAAQSGNAQVVEALIQSGADVNLMNKTSDYPLDLSAKKLKEVTHQFNTYLDPYKAQAKEAFLKSGISASTTEGRERFYQELVKAGADPVKMQQLDQERKKFERVNTVLMNGLERSGPELAPEVPQKERSRGMSMSH